MSITITITGIILLIAYAIGSVNFSVIFSRKFAGFDVREKGSGNAGTTNVLRTVGKKAALLTLICDILKGIIAIGIAILVGKIIKFDNIALLIQIAGIAVIIGHTYPIFFEFRGGKGVATALGVLLLSNWQIGCVCLVFGLLTIAFTRMVSAGSIAAAILFPIITLFMGGISPYYLAEGNYFIYSVCLAAIVVFNHRTNIMRILNGSENKLSFKNKN